ncbi:hypothetical protein DBR32_04410 [Taibaiella sp. KBW10]|uniref:hypothetical protein n=1 Tax=Taibaiella sp. KBW10 TaxID=2153357 RepID=UPI000F594A8C|nr:hypothetical protein [Taibaiella sp. KBW10]RQO31218.1 hypothetical protein DBR32_04410 [Taibaiella sp. KBW10]
MNKHTQSLNEKKLFNHIFNDRANKRLFWAAVMIYLLYFLGYKYAIAEADFYADSHSYIFAAVRDMRSYYRPFGYSKYLQIVHDFFSSSYAVVLSQYMVLCLSTLFCFFSVDFLFPFKNRKLKIFTLCLLVLNPIFLPLANQIASDTLFTTLTIVWFTSLLWIIRKPSAWVLVLQLIMLYWVFNVRYTALFYPIVTVVALLITHKAGIVYKAIGIAGTLLVIMGAYSAIKSAIYEETGTNVFSGFSGWQMANNALYIYHPSSENRIEWATPELKEFDSIVRYCYAHPSLALKEGGFRERQEGKVGTFFLWHKESPLKLYLYLYCRRYRVSYFNAWYALSGMYAEFGKETIMNNKCDFIKYQIVPNTLNFVLPHAEALTSNNMPDSSWATIETRNWFDLRPDSYKVRYPGLRVAIVKPFPYLIVLVHFLCVAVPALYLFRQRKIYGRWKRDFVYPVLLWYICYFGYFAFSVFAAIITLRYMLMWFVLGIVIPLSFIDQMFGRPEEQQD